MKSKKLKYIEIYVKERKDTDAPAFGNRDMVQRALDRNHYWGKEITSLVEGIYSSWKEVPEIVKARLGSGYIIEIPKKYLRKGDRIEKENLIVSNGLHKQIILN